MKTITYDRGRILEAPPEVVACLWTNWEIYDALLGSKFRIRRLRENAWCASYYFDAQLTLELREASLDAGRFVYSLRTTMFGVPASTMVTLRYECLMSGRTSVHGEFKSDLGTMALAMEPLVRGKINRAIDAVIDGGQTSCELLASSYAETLAMLPSQYQQTIAVYLETAKRLREGAAANSTILSPNEDQLHRMVPISSTQKIFVVHGRNEYYRQRVVNLLREWGCIPITLREQPNIGRTLIEKFEEHANADYAVVLLTADDKGALATERNHLPRPRQNVVFEMGYFIGRMTRERVCALYQEGVELPSDLAGIVYVPLDSNDQWQQVLLDELRAVGFDLKRQSELLVPVS